MLYIFYILYIFLLRFTLSVWQMHRCIFVSHYYKAMRRDKFAAVERMCSNSTIWAAEFPASVNLKRRNVIILYRYTLVTHLKRIVKGTLYFPLTLHCRQNTLIITSLIITRAKLLACKIIIRVYMEQQRVYIWHWIMDKYSILQSSLHNQHNPAAIAISCTAENAITCMFSSLLV